MIDNNTVSENDNGSSTIANRFSQATINALEEHLNRIRDKILVRADELAKKEGAAITPGFIHLAQAIHEYAPGKMCANESTPSWSRSLGLFSQPYSVTTISAILAFVFAVFGLLAINFSPEIGGGNYLDIAKIFAGAVVGSTSVAATSAFRDRG